MDDRDWNSVMAGALLAASFGHLMRGTLLLAFVYFSVPAGYFAWQIWRHYHRHDAASERK